MYVHTRTERKRRNPEGTNCEQFEPRHTAGPIEVYQIPSGPDADDGRRGSDAPFFARLELVRRLACEWVNGRHSVKRMRKNSIMESASPWNGEHACSVNARSIRLAMRLRLDHFPT